MARARSSLVIEMGLSIEGVLWLVRSWRLADHTWAKGAVKKHAALRSFCRPVPVPSSKTFPPSSASAFSCLDAAAVTRALRSTSSTWLVKKEEMALPIYHRLSLHGT